MNILFLNYTYPNPTNGGTERSIYNISKFLNSNGNNIFVGYFEGKGGSANHISASVDLTNNKVAHLILIEFIRKFNIKIVINFKKYQTKKILYSINSSNCILISSFRYSPEDTEQKLKIQTRLKAKKSIKFLIKKLLLPVYLFYSHRISKSRILRLYNISERYIVLSPKYIKPINEFLGIKMNSKTIAIPNMLSFNESLSIPAISKKERIVLIVARMEEKSKRILYALQIWKLLQDCSGTDNWDLVIVGTGSDLERYKLFVAENKIPNVSFEGRQDPYNYYKRAQVFLMTSAAEGFGITLIEAQQMGCIPIAFNSYSSLTDIIEDGMNGIVVENNNTELFVEKLKYLLSNSEFRQSLAANAIKMSSKFSTEIIGNRWLDVINECRESK